jgi:hypothetical protein
MTRLKISDLALWPSFTYLHSGNPRGFCTSSLVAARFFDALRGTYDDGFAPEEQWPQ